MTKVPSIDLHSLQHFPDVLKKADLHKLRVELMTCLPSLPNMPDLHKLREEVKTTLPSMDILPSLSGWHVMELLYNCLPERFSSGNNTDVCVLVMLLSPSPHPTPQCLDAMIILNSYYLFHD